MPWTCRRCTVEVDDAAPCPSCGAFKTSWTVVADRTRLLVFKAAQRRFSLHVGDGAEPRPRAGGGGEVRLEPAVRAPVLTKAAARALTAEGLLPPTRDVLFVALTAGQRRDLSLQVEVLFDTAPAADHALPGPPHAEGGTAYQPLVFVHGEGGLEDIDFGLPVIDLSEGNATGYAPGIEVVALGRPAQGLPTAAGEWIELELVDDAGQPVTGSAYTLLLADGSQRAGTVGDGGLALESALPATSAELDLPDHDGWALAPDPADEEAAGPAAQAATAARTTALLEFNTWRNTIGDAWVQDCEGALGMSTLTWVDPRVREGTSDPARHAAKAALTVDAVAALMAKRPHWLVLAGHNWSFADHSMMRGEAAYPRLKLYEDRIELHTAAGNVPARTFTKGSPELGLDAQVEVLMLGGCDVFTSVSTLKRLQRLFGSDARKPLLLGCRHSTSTDVVRAVLGYTIKDKSDRDIADRDWLPWEQGFFGRLQGRTEDAAVIRDAWMQAAKYGWGGTDFVSTKIPYRGTLHAFDADGKDWEVVEQADGTIEIVGTVV